MHGSTSPVTSFQATTASLRRPGNAPGPQADRTDPALRGQATAGQPTCRPVKLGQRAACHRRAGTHAWTALADGRRIVRWLPRKHGDGTIAVIATDPGSSCKSPGSLAGGSRDTQRSLLAVAPHSKRRHIVISANNYSCRLCPAVAGGLQHGSCTQTLQFCAAFWPNGALSSRI